MPRKTKKSKKKQDNKIKTSKCPVKTATSKAMRYKLNDRFWDVFSMTHSKNKFIVFVEDNGSTHYYNHNDITTAFTAGNLDLLMETGLDYMLKTGIIKRKEFEKMLTLVEKANVEYANELMDQAIVFVDMAKKIGDTSVQSKLAKLKETLDQPAGA